MREVVVIFGERPAENGTRMVKSLEAVPAEFEAWTVKENAPGVVGVPEMLPEEERVRPAGRSPLARVQVMGDEPIAERVAEYGTSTEAEGSDEVVMMGAVLAMSVVPDEDPE